MSGAATGGGSGGDDLIGATLIKDIRPTGPHNYRARVFVADRNMHATGRIRQVSPNQLKVSGCVLALILGLE